MSYTNSESNIESANLSQNDQMETEDFESKFRLKSRNLYMLWHQMLFFACCSKKILDGFSF